MIRRLSRVTGMMAGTAVGAAMCVYGAGELISHCIRVILP